MAMKTKLIITGFALIAISAFANAQNQPVQQRQNRDSAKGSAYVDANNDGICDNYAGGEKAVRTGKQGQGNGNCTSPGQGKGQGKGKGQGQGKGRNFTDANNNGICDRSENSAGKK